MHPNAELIARFYRAFGARDAEAMLACYAPDVRFSDAVFVGLEPHEARAMWRMLVGRAKDLRVEASAIEADDARGRAHWDAWYTFSTGRRVHNRIDADFTFRDGLIVEHRDSFDLWRWSRQALGPAGLLLGWSSFLTGKIRANARAGLAAYLRENPGEPAPRSAGEPR
jgi:ketosteroid isomerase-like protein